MASLIKENAFVQRESRSMTFWEFANELRKSGELCDIKFHVFDRNGVMNVLFAHKVIMAYCSPYLSHLIQGESVEHVTITEILEENFSHILQLVYQQVSQEDLRRLKNFQEVLKAAQVLQIDLNNDKFYSGCKTPMEEIHIQALQQTAHSDIKPEFVHSIDKTDELDMKLTPIESPVYCADQLQNSLEREHVNSISLEKTMMGDMTDFVCIDMEIKAAEILQESCDISTVQSPFISNVLEQKELVLNNATSLQITGDRNILDVASQGNTSIPPVSQTNLLKSEVEQLRSITHTTTEIESFVKCESVNSNDNKDIDSPSDIENNTFTDVMCSEMGLKKEPESVNDMMKNAFSDTRSVDERGYDANNSFFHGVNGCPDIKEQNSDDESKIAREKSCLDKVDLKKTKRKKKEISMDVLRRFCAKQAERKKKAVSGTQHQGTDIATQSKMEDGNTSLNMKVREAQNSLRVGNPKVFDKQPGPITCHHCGLVLPSLSLWERHVLKHTGERPFACEVCGKKFSRKGNLVVHQKSHGHRERKFKCNDCLASFLTKGALKSHHSNMHNTVTHSKCEHCGAVFKSAYSLKTHIETKHEIKQVLSCEDCDKTFTNPMYLKRHQLIHTDTLPFPCKHCELAFRTYGARATHMSVEHTKEMFICDACGNSYHSKSVLLAHRKRVHMEKDPSRECPICHKYVSNFYNHIRMHKSYEKGEVFSCPECGKTFPLKTYLTQHMFVHRKKRFSCSNCKKEFTFNASLQSHLKNCLQRKMSSSASLLPFTLVQSETSKHSAPLFEISELSFKNVQSTVQQPFVFKYQGNYGSILAKEETAAFEDEVEEQDGVDRMERIMENKDKAEISYDAENINQTLADTSTHLQLFTVGETSTAECSLKEPSSILQEEQFESSTQHMPGMRSIRIQPGDSGKSIMIEQTSGQEFSEHQLASIVNSLGVDTLTGDVQYVCILPE